MTSDPGRDQDDALNADFERLDYLTKWYLPGRSAPIADAFPHMSPEDRAEALQILERLGVLAEDRETVRARQIVLLSYARAEAALLDLIEDPGPAIDGDGPARDPRTGKLLPDEALRAEARELLEQVRRERAEVTGRPEDNEDE